LNRATARIGAIAGAALRAGASTARAEISAVNADRVADRIVGEDPEETFGIRAGAVDQNGATRRRRRRR